MAVLLDEAGASLLDEALALLLDEAGQPTTSVVASVVTSFQAHSAVTVQATMEFEAGLPVQAGMRTLPTEPWFSMYPG